MCVKFDHKTAAVIRDSIHCHWTQNSLSGKKIYFIGAFRQGLVKDFKLLKDITFMLNVLCINNLKRGHNCKCNDQPSITHMLWMCVNN